MNVNIFTVNDTTFEMVQCLFNIVNMFILDTKIAEIYDKTVTLFCYCLLYLFNKSKFDLIKKSAIDTSPNGIF